eukprot:GEZU01013277.1.p2 GENE.GEZU01013277.1~~GEZU01013277.1.p2  ORF type:complete len:313 (+),score=159.29 GEZU01013277.1:1778-2716(+)
MVAAKDSTKKAKPTTPNSAAKKSKASSVPQAEEKPDVKISADEVAMQQPKTKKARKEASEETKTLTKQTSEKKSPKKTPAKESQSTQQSEAKTNNNDNNSNKKNKEKSSEASNSNSANNNKKKQAANNEAKKENTKLYPAPPHSFTLEFKRKILRFKCTLHKIPEQFINLDVQEDGLHLDTLKFTKKFVLDVKYPDGIKVDVSPEQLKKLEAKCDYGILDVPLPVSYIPEARQLRELEIIKQKKKAKLIKFEAPVKKTIQERLEKEAKKAEKEAKKHESKKRKASELKMVDEIAVEQQKKQLERARNKVQGL